MNAITQHQGHVPAVQSVPDHIRQAAFDLQQGALSPATWKAYRSDWRAFLEWCDRQTVQAIPASPETVAAYIASQMHRGRKAASIARSIAAISCAHETAGHLPPGKTKIVQNALASVRRTIGTAQTKKAPATADKIAAMLALCPDTVKGKRDRAILSLGFAGAFRIGGA